MVSFISSTERGRPFHSEAAILSSDNQPDIARECGFAVARGVAGEASHDFEMFASRYPTADELMAWCSDTARWISDEPVDVENDRAGLLGLAVVGAVVERMSGAPRQAFIEEFWRTYAEATGNTNRLEGLLAPEPV